VKFLDDALIISTKCHQGNKEQYFAGMMKIFQGKSGVLHG
jgi:hypothetical protein